MRTLTLFFHLSGEELKERIRQAASKKEYRRLQCLYLVQEYEVTAAFVADVSGLSVSAVYRLMEHYNSRSPDPVACKPKGGRHQAYLSEPRKRGCWRS